MRRVLLAALFVGAALAGCDTTAPQPEPQVVVEAYLQAGAPLPTVRLTRTVPVDSAFRAERAAVQGATVSVRRVGGDSTGVPVPYQASDSVAGVYRPERRPTVRPGATYRLRVGTQRGATLQATTTVPEAVELVRTANDTTTYPSEEQPEPPQFALTIDPGTAATSRPSNRQNVYVLRTTSLLDFPPPDSIPPEALLTPFYLDSYNAEEDILASFRVNSSGLLNEANFERHGDGTVTVTLPWLAIAFYGPNQVAANVVDDNLYDFLRTQSAQQMGLAPGEIPNVIEHVEGGTGVFGSYAQARATVLIRPPQLSSRAR